MKKNILIGLIILLTGCNSSNYSLKEVWRSSDKKLSIPESVTYDKSKDIIYASNVNSIKSSNPWVNNGGFISKLDKNGTILVLKWATGLQAPKGIDLLKKSLFVADLNQVVEIDTTSGKILHKFKAPKGINKLNDITCDDKNNRCFVSDSGTKKIFEVSKDGKFRLIYRRENSKKAEQNGLLVDGDNLIMQGRVGELKALDLKEKKIKIITKDLDIPIDGLTKYGDNYIVSTWSGGIYLINKNGEVEEIFGDKFNTADIFYSKDLNLLLVPDFAHNIVAFRVNRLKK